MFITAPGLVQHLHPAQVAPRQTHWPAITLAMERPWYLLVHQVVCHGQKRSQTSLVAWDTTLLDLLAHIPVADLSGIARLDRRHGAGPSWALQWISALWAPAPGESSAVGPLLFQLGADPQLRTTHGLPVAEAPGRRLLYQASGPPAPVGGVVSPWPPGARP